MIWNKLHPKHFIICCSNKQIGFNRFASEACTANTEAELNNEIKHKIENHWGGRLGDNKFIPNDNVDKRYILSMFPYPSGKLHMGHVRVYAISDAMARYYKMNGYNVLHPMGWDAFGLPAENAALQRKIPANLWTDENILKMKEQLQKLGCSFDWSREITTCSPEYYKWTQSIFLKLYNSGLAYQKEAVVNWDPVDETVLADEQVDDNGLSWRSGAKVEKRLLKQWFIRTTKFAKPLLEGLDDPQLVDWKDIIKLQKHWIGECDGYLFDLSINGSDDKISIWTTNPEDFVESSFLILRNTNNLFKKLDKNSTILNPFSSKYPTMKIIFDDEANFPSQCDAKLGAPFRDDYDKQLADKHNILYSSEIPNANYSSQVISKANDLEIGGYSVSSKLKDWLISRQRYWGTPIPIIHCHDCGVVPVPDSELPVELPPFDPNSDKLPTKNPEWLSVTCPQCKKPSQRESDTMDTFVDSSWYFCRFIDPHNRETCFSHELASKIMPVDLYIGGKEHAVLHLYYARFMTHFLNSIGLLTYPEPFKRLLVQGMVMGQSFRVKGSGKYLTANEVDVVDAKKNKAIEKSTGETVIATWEKMSKSKMNGIDPEDVIGEHGCDTTRLIMLADVAPTSHRNWSDATFPGILNWQKRLWLTITEFHNLRSSLIPGTPRPYLQQSNFAEENSKMFDARNYFTSGVTFNFKHSHQLSVGISKMQGLTNALRRASKETMTFSPDYEQALAAQIIMLAPMAPHFASELWSKFTSAPNRLNSNEIINWSGNVLDQPWPQVDMNFDLELIFKINSFEVASTKLPRHELDIVEQKTCEDLAFKNQNVIDYIGTRGVKVINFVHYPGYQATLNIYLDRPSVKEKESKEKAKKEKRIAKSNS